MLKNREYKSFTDVIWGSVLSTGSVLFGAITLVSFFVLPYVEVDQVLKYTNAAPFAIFLLYVSYVFAYSAYYLYSRRSDLLPEVKNGSAAPAPYEDLVARVILEPSALFAQGAIIAAYREADGIEEFIGLGQILNVQQNGLIQVLITQSISGDDVWAKIKANDAGELKKLKIKPTVPHQYIEALNNE